MASKFKMKIKCPNCGNRIKSNVSEVMNNKYYLFNCGKCANMYSLVEQEFFTRVLKESIEYNKLKNN